MRGSLKTLTAIGWQVSNMSIAEHGWIVLAVGVVGIGRLNVARQRFWSTEISWCQIGRPLALGRSCWNVGGSGCISLTSLFVRARYDFSCERAESFDMGGVNGISAWICNRARGYVVFEYDYEMGFVWTLDWVWSACRSQLAREDVLCWTVEAGGPVFASSFLPLVLQTWQCLGIYEVLGGSVVVVQGSLAHDSLQIFQIDIFRGVFLGPQSGVDAPIVDSWSRFIFSILRIQEVSFWLFYVPKCWAFLILYSVDHALFGTVILYYNLLLFVI